MLDILAICTSLKNMQVADFPADAKSDVSFAQDDTLLGETF